MADMLYFKIEMMVIANIKGLSKTLMSRAIIIKLLSQAFKTKK
jgi:hypothetical protein